jgi:hypothetical protein
MPTSYDEGGKQWLRLVTDEPDVGNLSMAPLWRVLGRRN